MFQKMRSKKKIKLFIVVMHCKSTKLSYTYIVYRHATETKETNISNKRNKVKIPNWQEADQLAIYKA